jgi:hypothetical protein
VEVKVKAQNLWACGGAWGLRPKVIHWLYVSVIRTCVTFASWLSGSLCQEETKQDTRISMLRDTRGNAHYSHKCHGGAHLPPPLE